MVASSDVDTSDGSWSDLSTEARETWNEIAPVFENLTLDQLINSTGRISWSKESLRTLFKFCSQHQISARNLPSLELLADLLKLLGAPHTDAAAYTNAAKRTVSAMTSRVSLRNPALTESRGVGAPWKCVWAGWSVRWFENEDWNGDITMPEDVTALERLPRESILQRHGMGEKALLNALVEFQAARVTAIRTVKHSGTTSNSRHTDLHARIAALEGEKLALEQQTSTLATQNTDSLANLQGYIGTLEREKASLEAQISSQNTNDARISILTDQVTALERRNTMLEKGLKDKNEASTHRFEIDLARLKAKNSDLQQQLAAKSTSSLLKAKSADMAQKLQAENQVLKEKEEEQGKKNHEMYLALLRQDEKVRLLVEETVKLNAELDMYRHGDRAPSTPPPAPSRVHWTEQKKMVCTDNDDASPLAYLKTKVLSRPTSSNEDESGAWDAL